VEVGTSIEVAAVLVTGRRGGLNPPLQQQRRSAHLLLMSGIIFYVRPSDRLSRRSTATPAAGVFVDADVGRWQ